ncbi:hypothetical protein KY346_04055 [Candidatus Woesearchaeota archaeon]|nr:hypothetical protein [Candidatus Woesearchaeota archaeon]
MIFFSSKRVDKKIEQLDARLAASFAKVRRDTEAIYQWLNFFYDESNKQKALIRHQDEAIKEMEMQIERMPKSREEIKAIVDAYYDHEALLEKMSRIAEKIERLEAVKQRPARRPAPMAAPAAPAAARPVSALREKMIKKITRNSKDYIKSMIASLIRKYGRISAMALREIVVDEQGLCSKSSFYRLLDEIEKEAGITVLSSGREKVYVAELSKPARK